MGLEAKCTVRIGRDNFAGRAHLDSEKLTIRGKLKLEFALKNIRSASVHRDRALRLTPATGVLALDFGDSSAAEKWARKIRSPKNLLDKLGVKPDSRVAILGVDDPGFLGQLRRRLTALADEVRDNLDFVFYAADSPVELAKLSTLKRRLQPAGAIWVVSRKGKAATIRDTDVMQAARTAGLADNKVCSFSATHTALKLVIPLAAR